MAQPSISTQARITGSSIGHVPLWRSWRCRGFLTEQEIEEHINFSDKSVVTLTALHNLGLFKVILPARSVRIHTDNTH